MGERPALKELLERIENADGPDREFDQEVFGFFGLAPNESGYRALHRAPPYTASTEAAIGLHRRILPDWWLSTCLCSLSGDASCGPDYNGPARERLLREFPVARFDDGFHVDLRPGDGWHRCAYAILHVMIQALIAIEEQRAGSEAAP